MSVVFHSTIKNDGEGGWVIELKDTLDGRVEICDSLENYEQTIEKMGEDYGGHIDEVKWFQDDDVSPQCMDELRIAMKEYQDKLDAKESNL
jgi:hypothetical protein